MRRDFFAGVVRIVVCLVLVAVTAPVAFAQEGGEEDAPEMSPEMAAMMEAYIAAGEINEHHRMMAGWVGTWDLEGKGWIAPGAPPTSFGGTAERSLIHGGRVLVENITSEFAGQPFEGHLMMGFDNHTRRHWSVWTDSMSTAVIQSNGRCSDGGERCAMHADFYDPAVGRHVHAMDVITTESATKQRLESFRFGPDGEKQKVMEIHYTKRGE